MTYYIYELKPSYINEKVYKGKNPPFQVTTIEIPDNMTFCDYMDKYYYNKLCWTDIFQDLEIDKKYYVFRGGFSDFSTLSLYKGFAYWDAAEHDERVVIAAELNLTKEQACIL